MSNRIPPARSAFVVAVSISPGGIPKRAVPLGAVTHSGLVGDGRNHAKHIRPNRAISLLDLEILEQLVREGFPLEPGAAGENLTVAGLRVQEMPPGTLLQIGDVLLKLEEPRKPCYVLDAINPRLKEAIVGRCGYMASVLTEGHVHPGAAVTVVCRDGQRQDIHDQKSRRQASLRLLLGPADGVSQEVDARNHLAPAGEVEGVLAHAASGLQDRPDDPVGHVEERLLRPTDLPRSR